MKVRFTAEIIDDNGNILKLTCVSRNKQIPDLTDLIVPQKFLKKYLINTKDR